MGIAARILTSNLSTIPASSVNRVQDDQADQHSLLSSLEDRRQGTQQSSEHYPAHD